MDIDALLSPVSDDAPCGPDLSTAFDAEYDMAYYDAINELPEEYFRQGMDRGGDLGREPDRIFDPKTVNFREESKKLDAVLARTRDVRLLVLRAQWAALSGQLPAVSESLTAIAALLETHGAQVHPTDSQDRRDAINDLDNITCMVQPIEFAGLTGTTDVTLRKLRVAKGESSPLQAETDLDLAALMDSLGSRGNAKAVEKTFATVTEIRDALARIVAACKASDTAKFTPDFGRLQPAIDTILRAISDARADLRVADVPAETAEPPADDDQDGAAPAARPAVAASATAVVSHAHARRLLEACERYYRKHEPSSATLLLVTQARLLIGRPLMEALETLLPEHSSNAVIDFGPQSGFMLTSERLKSLSDVSPDDTEPDDTPEPDPGPEPKVDTPAEASAAIKSVEDYFRQVERSSPIPVLLQRGRSYLDRDFQSIIDELIPKDD